MSRKVPLGLNIWVSHKFLNMGVSHKVLHTCVGVPYGEPDW